MDIDLGEELTFNVKVGSNSYILREPTYKDVKALQGSDVEEDVAFINLVVGLGMPEDVAENLGVLKLKKLADGIMAPFSEKK